MTAFAAEPLVTEGPIIELPKFEVTDTRLLPPPESWLYAEIPGYEILSNISVRETKRFVQDFLLLQEAIGVIMPSLRGHHAAVPTSLILAGRGQGFNRFVPVNRGDDRYRVNSLFFEDPERASIVIDFALAELQLEDNTTQESDPYHGFYREFFRFMVRRQAGKSPPWFEEGLVQLFAQIDVNKKWVNFAMVGDGFGGERTGDFNRMLVQRALMPFPELFSEKWAGTRNTFWSAQSYAFVHMCLYGRGQKYQKPFLKFLTRLDREPLSEELFKECFQMDYKKMALELRGYIEFTDYKYMQFAAKKGQALPDPPPFKLGPAPDAVVGRITGETLHLAGNAEAARNALIAPYIRGERDPRLLAALGLHERNAGRDERAQKFLEAAANAKVVRARAYFELARMRFAEATAKPAAPDGKFDAVQTTRVLEPLVTASQQPPPMIAVYVLMADTWLRSTVMPTRDQFDVLLHGVVRFQQEPSLVLRAALFATQSGFRDDALRLAEYGAKIARDSGTRDQFGALVEELKR